MAYQKYVVGREFIRFEKTGDSIEGYLDRIEETKVLGKDTERVVLIGDDGIEIYLPSNFQINEFAKRVIDEYGTGIKVKIEYKGDRKIKGGRTLRLFDFYIDPEDVLQRDSQS